MLEVLIEDSVYVEENRRESVSPLGRVRLGLEGGHELTMKAYDHAVRLRVVGGGALVGGTKELQEMLSCVRFALCTRVGDDDSRSTKA